MRLPILCLLFLMVHSTISADNVFFTVTDPHYGNELTYEVESEADKIASLISVNPTKSKAMVVIPSTVTSPDDNTVYQVKTIKANACQDKQVKAYYALSGIETIEANAFTITNYTRVIFLGEGLKHLAPNAFKQLAHEIGLTIYFPTTIEPVELNVSGDMFGEIHTNDWVTLRRIRWQPMEWYINPEAVPPIYLAFGMGRPTSFSYVCHDVGGPDEEYIHKKYTGIHDAAVTQPSRGEINRIFVIDDNVEYYNGAATLSESGAVVVLGKSLKEVGYNSLSGYQDPDLKYREYASEVYCRGTHPVTIDDNTFGPLSYKNATVYVPEGKLSMYRAYGWDRFKNIKEYKVRDYIKPTGVRLSTAIPGLAPDIKSGTVMHFKAEAIPANADFANIQAWWVDDPHMFQVVDNGVIKGVANYDGETVLHVSTINGHQDSMTIRVSPDFADTGSITDDIANDGVSVIGEGSLRAVATGVPDGTVYCLADMSGRIITSGTGDGFVIQLQVPSQGIYLFRYGTKTIKTVIR